MKQANDIFVQIQRPIDILVNIISVILMRGFEFLVKFGPTCTLLLLSTFKFVFASFVHYKASFLDLLRAQNNYFKT